MKKNILLVVVNLSFLGNVTEVLIEFKSYKNRSFINQKMTYFMIIKTNICSSLLI